MSNTASATVGNEYPSNGAPLAVNRPGQVDLPEVTVRQRSVHSITAHELRPQRSGLFATAKDRDGLPPEKLTEDNKITYRGIEMSIQAAERAGIIERTSDGEGWREVTPEERSARDQKVEQERRSQLAAEMAPDTPLDYVAPGITGEINSIARACAAGGVDMDQHAAMIIGNYDQWMSHQAPRVAAALGIPFEKLSAAVERISEAVSVQFANEAEAFGADGYAFLDWLQTQPGYRSAALRAYHGDYRPMRELAKLFAGTAGALPENHRIPNVRKTAKGHEVVDVMVNGKRIEVSVRNARQLGLI